MFSSATIILSGVTHLTEEQTVVKVTLTGKRIKKWVEWKNPDDTFREAWVDTHEVVLETPDGKLIGKYYIYGDYVALRARVVRFGPWLNFFGLPNVCLMESIYNGYRTMERHNRYPHLGLPLPFPTSLWNPIWEKFFFRDWKNRLLQSATLESNYFPLLNRQESFLLTISPGGLTAKDC